MSRVCSIDQLLQQLRCRYIQRTANLDEFRHVQPALATLVFGDERLRSPQAFRQLHLRQPGLITRLAHQDKKLPVQRRRKGFHGADALSDDPGMVYPELEYPKLGLLSNTSTPSTDGLTSTRENHNMAQIQCKKCGATSPSGTTQCPQCGAKLKKRSVLKMLGIGFIVLIAASTAMTVMVKEDGASTSSEKSDGKLSLNHMVSSCQVEWEMKFKASLNDPGSFEWDSYKNAELGMFKKKPVIAVPYRARNQLNGLVLQQAICQINPDTGETVAVLK